MDNLNMDNSSSKRMLGIDLFRVIAILAVIVIHTSPFKNGPGNSSVVYFLTNHIARFAVPFFFIVSGYFWGLKSETDGLNTVTSKQVKRLLSQFILWNIVYVIFTFVFVGLFPEWFGASGKELVTDMKSALIWPRWYIFDGLFSGIIYHLWFLTALISALIVSWALLKHGFQKWFLTVGLVLYVLGVLGGSYTQTPVGIDMHFYTRNGIFLSTSCLAIGWWLASRKSKPFPMRLGIYTALAGLVFHFVEVYFLQKNNWISLFCDYVFSTIIYGFGIALISFVLPVFGFARMISKLGTYTFGIYLVHVIFVMILRPSAQYVAFVPWQFLYPVLVFVLSLGTVHIMSKNALTRRFVR